MFPPVLYLVLLLIIALLTTLLAVIHSLARTLLYPPRMTDGKAMYVLKRMSPTDVGLDFESVSFDVPDAETGRSIRIAGWWIDARADRTCVMLHGYGDAKVGALAWAPMWRELGWNLLLVDLRGHGESGGRACTGGVLERDDLDAVLNQLRAERPSACARLVVFGVSLGGAVALATAARRTDLDGVIADSVYSDYARAAVIHGGLIGAPVPSLVPLAVRLAQRLAGVDFAIARPLDTIGASACPILLIHGDADPFVPASDVVALTEALSARHNAGDDHFIVEGAGHGLGIVADRDAYAERIATFLSKAQLTSRDESPTRA